MPLFPGHNSSNRTSLPLTSMVQSFLLDKMTFCTLSKDKKKSGLLPKKSLCFLWDPTFFEVNAGAHGHQPWTYGEYRELHLHVDIFGSSSLSTDVLSFCILPKELT